MLFVQTCTAPSNKDSKVAVIAVHHGRYGSGHLVFEQVSLRECDQSGLTLLSLGLLALRVSGRELCEEDGRLRAAPSEKIVRRPKA